MRKQRPKHSASWGRGRAIDHAPRFYDIAFEYQKLNTREARVAFTDTWLKVWANSFQETWPMIYKVLEWIEAEKLYEDSAAMDAAESFPDFKSYFEARLKKPFTMWMELEQTHHYVTNFAPELIDRTWGDARAKAAEHYRQIDAADQANKEQSKPGRRTDLIKDVQKPRSDLFDNVDDIKEVKAPTGTSAAYAIRRLRKDRPDIHQRVLDGELTAHAGMIEAGFRKKPGVLKKLLLLWAKASDDERAEFRAKIDDIGEK